MCYKTGLHGFMVTSLRKRFRKCLACIATKWLHISSLKMLHDIGYIKDNCMCQKYFVGCANVCRIKCHLQAFRK